MSRLPKKSVSTKKNSVLNFLKNTIVRAPKLIQDQEHLLNICNQIKDNTTIAIDTEFMRERTYYPLLCLIQINIDGKCFAIDALAENIDLKPFFLILENKKITKIFHSSNQDIDVLIHTTGEAPKSITDTQIMANFCGFDYNVSYAKLVKNLLNKNLDKDWQRSDWQNRPLHREQIEYALSDVLYLPKIHKILEQKLANNGKAPWFAEEMEIMLAKKNDIDGHDLYKKFPSLSKSSNYKDNITMLVPWRDNLAKKYNVPRSFIIKDDLLLNIASSNPPDLQRMERYCSGNKFMSAQDKKEILSLLDNKVADNNDNIEAIDKINFRLSTKQDETYQKAKNLLHKKAYDHDLKSEFIINQNDLKQIILGHKKISDVLPGWRYKVFGNNLEKLILEISESL